MNGNKTVISNDLIRNIDKKAIIFNEREEKFRTKKPRTTDKRDHVLQRRVLEREYCSVIQPMCAISIWLQLHRARILILFAAEALDNSSSTEKWERWERGGKVTEMAKEIAVSVNYKHGNIC